jgi:hypothetical protein
MAHSAQNCGLRLCLSDPEQRRVCDNKARDDATTRRGGLLSPMTFLLAREDRNKEEGRQSNCVGKPNNTHLSHYILLSKCLA